MNTQLRVTNEIKTWDDSPHNNFVLIAATQDVIICLLLLFFICPLRVIQIELQHKRIISQYGGTDALT